MILKIKNSEDLFMILNLLYEYNVLNRKHKFENIHIDSEKNNEYVYFDQNNFINQKDFNVEPISVKILRIPYKTYAITKDNNEIRITFVQVQNKLMIKNEIQYFCKKYTHV